MNAEKLIQFEKEIADLPDRDWETPTGINL